MRNSFDVQGRWNIPLVHKQEVDTRAVSLIACSDTRSQDNTANRKNGVHFFVDDYRFEGIYAHPERTLAKYSQYAFLLTPDFSTYADMDLWRQIESVAKNRWVGAFCQSSFDFCFDGVEKNGIVAVSTLGCRKSKHSFLCGYEAMLNKLSPQTIICFGEPFPEMQGNIVFVDDRASRKVVR